MSLPIADADLGRVRSVILRHCPELAVDRAGKLARQICQVMTVDRATIARQKLKEGYDKALKKFNAERSRQEKASKKKNQKHAIDSLDW